MLAILLTPFFVTRSACFLCMFSISSLSCLTSNLFCHMWFRGARRRSRGATRNADYCSVVILVLTMVLTTIWHSAAATLFGTQWLCSSVLSPFGAHYTHTFTCQGSGTSACTVTILFRGGRREAHAWTRVMALASHAGGTSHPSSHRNLDANIEIVIVTMGL
jgi:predicted membrane channel-forming protein YqfA (hemolysin III family)